MPLNHYVTLGRSGLRVSPFCLGTMTFGNESWGSSVEESMRILDRYMELGGNFVDTANNYSRGHAEKILGDHLGRDRRKRERLVLATKFFSSMFPGDPNAGGASRKAILAQLDESLRRLQTDYIDLYWMHAWDALTPIDETLRALEDVIRSGRVRYIGFSDSPAWKVAEAQVTAAFRGWSPLVAIQVEYSLLERTSEAELLPMASELGLGVTAWSPLKNGVLTGKYSREQRGAHRPARGAFAEAVLHEERTYDILDVVTSIAQELNTTAARVALAWVQSKRGVTSTIIGARSVTQLDENVPALELSLSTSQLERLDTASAPRLGFPAELLRFIGRVGYADTTINGHTYPATPYAPKSDAERF